MNTLQSSLRAGLIWLVPTAAIAILFLWQTDWGRAFARTPPAETAAAAQPLTVALLPEYTPPAADTDIVERTPFNPTRRPAPTPVQEAAKKTMPKGQFTLTGTLVVDGKAFAYLREQSGGKQRRVNQGETVNGMLVAEIKADRVKLTMDNDSEELVMKLAIGPKTTIQPVMTPPPGAPPVRATAPQAATSTTPNSPPQPRDVAEILAERRRAARAAEAAAQNLPPGTPNPELVPQGQITAPTMPPVPRGDMGSNDPRWQQLYQRYQQPRGR